MSELSTVAIKDGHRGHAPHYQHSQGPSGLSNQLDAERADRISRLAGLERVTTARNPGSTGNITPGGGTYQQGQPQQQQFQQQIPPTLSYFDATGNPAIGRERSTVGSASATGSVGARTTWAGSEAGERDYDKMSESQDMDMDTSSVGGMSDEGTASLVGFGEGARTPARQSTISSPGMARGPSSSGGMGGMLGGGGNTPRDARMIDGMASYDAEIESEERRNTTSQYPSGFAAGTPGAAEAERIVRENMDTTSADRMRRGQGPGDLGTFGFEK